MNGNTYELTIEYAPKDVIAGEDVIINGKLTLYGKPVEGVDVTLYINGSEKARTQTDKNGEYRFTMKFNNPGVYIAQTIAYKRSVIEISYLKYAAIAAATALIGGVAIEKTRRK